MARGERAARAVVRRARAGAARVRGAGAGPVVSVVVAVRGPARHLRPCVDRLLASSHRGLEILVAADPDDAAAVAALADLPPARRVRRAPASGQRPWLDDAVAAARGEYLCFVDADDLVPTDAHARLLRILRETGADLVAGSTRAPGTARDPDAGWRDDLLERHDVARTGPQTLATCPDALVDLALVNKMFRLSSWRLAGPTLRSWPGAADAVAAAYLAAAGFALTPATVYEEQARDLTAPVEERERFDPRVVGARADALDAAAAAVHRHDPALLEGWLVGVLTHVLPPLYVDAVGGGPGYLDRLRPLVRRLLERTTPERLADVPVAARVAAWVAAHGSLDDVALLEDHFADHPDGLPTGLDTAGRRVVLLPAGLGVEPPPGLSRVQQVDHVLRARVAALVREGTRLRLDGAAFAEYDGCDEPPTVALVGGPGGDPVPLDVERRTDPGLNLWARRAWEDRSGSGFTARLEAAALPGPADGRFEVEVAMAGRVVTLSAAGPDAAPEGGDPRGAAVLDGVRLDGDELVLSGPPTGGATVPATAALHGGRGRTAEARVRVDRDGFAATVPLRTTLFGTEVHLPAGRFTVELRDADGARVPARWSPRLLGEPPDLVGDRASAAPGHDGDRATVTLGAPLDRQDRSAFGQARLRTVVYAAPAATPYGSTVLLETFRGRSVGDNPGAVGRELARRDLGLDLVWVTDDPSVEPPAGGRGVPRRSREWYDVLGRARAYVGNAGAPYWFEKRPGQVHLQTWHGTPLKRIGEDRGRGDFSTWRHRRRIAGQAARWDALISPSPFCSPILRSAFGYDGPLLEVGYPRNDLLLSQDGPRVRARVRAALGVADTDRVVLYAPTWREYVGVRDSKPLYLDAEALTRRLGDVVVLVRGHYNSTGQDDVFAGSPRIHDVTRYPDIADLYLAADVLVTDYSSVMFDFALTDKPVVLLTPDLEQYRDVERGFYFDIEALAPGPLVTSTAEVADVIDGPDGWAPARRTFRERFCPWDDGRASARTVDWLLARM